LLKKDLKPSTIKDILEKELNVEINYNTFYKALKKIIKNKKQKGEKNA
jgi:predicted Zn-ribbon and HTH transcriptional regulator